MKNKIVLLLPLFCLSISSCSMSYSPTEELVDDMFLICTSQNDAFVGKVYLPITINSPLNIVIPDECEGVPVTRLGGYFGRGVPTPFIFVANEDSSDGYYFSSELNYSDLDYVNVDINLYLGVNIKSFYNTLLQRKYIVKLNDDIYDVIYKLNVTFKIDESNPYFYAFGSKVFNKSDGSELIYD